MAIKQSQHKHAVAACLLLPTCWTRPPMKQKSEISTEHKCRIWAPGSVGNVAAAGRWRLQVGDSNPHLRLPSERAHLVCGVKRSTQHSASELWVPLSDWTKVL